MKKDQSKSPKPADKGKVKNLPERKLTAEQERKVKGGGKLGSNVKGSRDLFM